MIEDIDGVVLAETRIPGLMIEQVGGLSPLQADGTLHGMELYFRSRGTRTSLEVGASDHGWLYEAILPADFRNTDGVSFFAAAMLALVPRLERAQTLWTFEAVSELDRYDGKLKTCSLRGRDAADAYHQLHQPSPETLRYYGNTLESWLAGNAGYDYKPQPLNQDLRTWPDPEPIFRVLPA